MMTIKQFATLCGCNTQTLRYYDKIGLLKPVRVDQWSGYRYYEKEQAVGFIKIKSLQAADFTIDEIKALLTKSEQEIFAAFEQKIAEQSQKLERIKQIQRSYLTEKNNMEKLIKGLSGFLTSQMNAPELQQEFGMTPEAVEEAVLRVRAYLEAQTKAHLPAEPEITMTVEGKVFRGIDEVTEAVLALDERNLEDDILLGDGSEFNEEGICLENYEAEWQCSGWQYVYEFLDTVPSPEAGQEYCLLFLLNEEKYPCSAGFLLSMISAMLPKTEGADRIILGCCAEKSPDGQNHFRLMRKKGA